MITFKPQTSNLHSLPPELVQIISNELDTLTLRQLRLTCKDFANLLETQLFHTFVLDITRNTIDKVLSQLDALYTGNRALCYATRKLVIRSLSPACNPADHWPRSIVHEHIANAAREEPVERVIDATKYVDAHLFDAVAAFKNVRSVEWVPNAGDSESAHRSTMKAIKTFADLHRFRVHLPNIKIALELDSLQCLQTITLDGSSHMYQEDIIESLARAIAQNQSLTSIDISRTWLFYCPGNSYRYPNLHQLFKYYPAAAPPLRLRHLALGLWLVRLDNITLPHLTHLTSLSLTRVGESYATHATPPASFLPTHVQEDPIMLQEKSKYGSSLEDIWATLIHVGVRLEAITVDSVPHSFLGYLASYQGLKKLRLTPGGFHEGTSSDNAAQQFFAIILQNHTQSLEDLQVAALFEGLWCFGSHNLDVLSKCTKLKKLRMSIISNQIKSEPLQHESPTKEPDVLKLLLDTISTCMPDINIVQIAGANQESLRGSRTGILSIRHFLDVNMKMTNAILDYVAPPSCQRLPSLMLSSARSLYSSKWDWESNITVSNSIRGLKGPPKALKYSVVLREKGINEEWHEWL